MKRKKGKYLLAVTLLIVCLTGLFVVVSNYMIVSSGKKKLAEDQVLTELNADCILILGAGVWENHEPSPMLADRLDEGLRLYKMGAAPKILVSGDHGQADYDEVNVMKRYLIDAGVSSEDIFMDHAGFSTYESIYRAKKIFGVERLIVVTQTYHIYRAIYICERMEIDVYGSPSDPRKYRGKLYRICREMLARDKDIFTCLFKLKPTFLGERIDITGNGDITND